MANAAGVENTFYLGNTITPQSIFDILFLYICRYCKNIGNLRNDIPLHFRSSHRYIFNNVGKTGDVAGSYERSSTVIEFYYNSDNKTNSLFEIVNANVVSSNLYQIFSDNGIKFSDMNKTIISFSDLLKTIYIGLQFFDKHVLKVYFPFTNQFILLYDGSGGTAVVYNKDAKENIEKYVNGNLPLNDIYEIFLTYLLNKKITCPQYKISIKRFNYDTVAYQFGNSSARENPNFVPSDDTAKVSIT